MSSPDGVLIREMRVADIPAGLGLCRASGWNQTERDWLYFLQAAPHGALVAVENGRVIGTVATLPYGPFAWIAMVLVDPAVRHRGIGTLLLDRGLALVPEGVTARLDATPAGEVLYRKLGFDAEYGVARLFLDGEDSAAALARRSRAAAKAAPGVRPLAIADWPAVHAIDARAFGASRASLLERLAADAPEYAWVAEEPRNPGTPEPRNPGTPEPPNLGTPEPRNLGTSEPRNPGTLRGYLLGRHGHVREHLGPLIGDSSETAALIVDACLAAHPDRRFILDAPDDQHAWRAHLAQLGFVIERPFLRMHRGRLSAPGQPSQIYAITGAEFG